MGCPEPPRAGGSHHAGLYERICRPESPPGDENGGQNRQRPGAEMAGGGEGAGPRIEKSDVRDGIFFSRRNVFGWVMGGRDGMGMEAGRLRGVVGVSREKKV